MSIVSGEGARRVLESIQAVDRVGPGMSIAVVKADLMGIEVNVICGIEDTPVGTEGALLAFSPIAVICDPAISKRLKLAGHEPEDARRIGFVAPEGRA